MQVDQKGRKARFAGKFSGTLAALGRAYLISWGILIWGAFCFAAGGAWALATVYGYLVATGKLPANAISWAGGR